VRRPEYLVRLAVRALLLAGLSFPQAGLAQAATFTVDPTQLFLSAKATSALLSLRNESKEPLRFQLSLSAWDQRTNGEMALTPTRDIIFFPQLLTLAPGEERKVRVGLAPSVTAGDAERTYRLFVEELPASQAGPQPSGVKVLTRMGIPIFLQPPSAAAKPSIGDLAVKAGRFGFVVHNLGNAHFVPDSIRVEGLAADGGVIFAQLVSGWYVLAGGSRTFDVEVPKVDCARVTAITVAMRVGESTVPARLATPAGACGSTTP
jgi:fimbrial chaperone protein